MGKIISKFGWLGLICLLVSLSLAHAEPKKTSAVKTSDCSALLMKIAAGYEQTDDDFYDSVTLSIDAIRAHDIFWWRELVGLEALALKALERRGEPEDEGDLPLNLVRAESKKFRLENMTLYAEKFETGTAEEKLLALNSFFLGAVNDDVSDMALKGVEAGLKTLHPEIQRYAYRGLWSLWVVFDSADVAGTEGKWAERRQKVEDLFAEGLKARLMVLEFDLLNGRLLSDESRTRMSEIIRSRKQILSQNEAEAFYETLVHFLKIEQNKKPMTRLTFEAAYDVRTFYGHDLAIDFRARAPEESLAVPMFSPELIQLLHSVDFKVNEDARLMATFIMEFVRDQKDPRFQTLLQNYRVNLRMLEQDDKSRKEFESKAENDREAQLQFKRRDEILSAILESNTTDKEDAVISKIENYLSTYHLEYQDVRTREDAKGVSLDVAAERMGNTSLANRLREEFK